MKITQVLNYTTFYNAVKSQKMPIKLAYRLSKIAQAVEQEQKFYQDRVRSLLDVYAEKDENGTPITNEDGGIKLKQEYRQECLAQFGELESLDVDIKFEPIKIDELESLELTPEQIQSVMPFLAD